MRQKTVKRQTTSERIVLPYLHNMPFQRDDCRLESNPISRPLLLFTGVHSRATSQVDIFVNFKYFTKNVDCIDQL